MRLPLSVAAAGLALAVAAPVLAQDLGLGTTSGGVVQDRTTGRLDDRPGASAQQGGLPSLSNRWSTLDQDADNLITRQEFDSGRIGQPRGFSVLDSDGDGVVTLQEYIQERQSLLERRFQAADLDRDGVLTENDFATRRSQVFDRLDANGDGMLSAEELPPRGARR